MAKSQFRKSTNQKSKKGLITTTVFKLGNVKVCIQKPVESKKKMSQKRQK
jgi:hypothetical protein